jgi:hypothetical protein
MVQDEDMDMSGGRISKEEWTKVPLHQVPLISWLTDKKDKTCTYLGVGISSA